MLLFHQPVGGDGADAVVEICSDFHDFASIGAEWQEIVSVVDLIHGFLSILVQFELK